MMRRLKNSQGQFVVEGVLLMVLSIGVLMTGLKFLNDSGIMKNLIADPWQKMAGMIESGVWDTADKAAPKHPNQKARSLSLDPDNI